MSNEEQGIAQAQIEAARRQNEQENALAQTQHRGIAYIDERIFIYLGAVGLLALVVVWATADSPLVLYGSLLGVIGCVALWGLVRIRRIERVRAERARQVERSRGLDGTN